MGFGAPIPRDSTGRISHSTLSHEGNAQIMGTHRHQNEYDPPPAYTEYASRRPQITPVTSSQRLRKPIVVPATAASLGSPFLRAYPPSLQAFQLSRNDFLDVLDGLNRVAVQSPPLRALGLVGEVLGVVPLSSTQMAGLALSSAAQIGTVALSKGATEVYLRKVNKEIFAPRGLKMEIAKLEAMARVNKLPILDAAGRIRSDVQVLQPLLDEQEIQTMGRAQRWLRALEPWVQPLELETLPPINMDTNLWGRIHTSASEQERKNSEKKVLKDRSKAFDKHQKDIEKAEERREKEMARLDRREQKALENSRSHRVDHKLRIIDKKRERAELRHHNRMEKAAEDSMAKDKEAKAMTKVLWLIIRNIDEDSGVQGTMDFGE
ncbi:hypothetical protein F5Y12DRAFT_706395 [Xylaria sp. FL1777]|nr:hypothetical protein F5Y12DRAFT_706395 [Xylaria sp. FL1777]